MAETTHRLSIIGMTCSSCSQRVETVLNRSVGVISAEVSHETNSGTVLTTNALTAQDVVNIVLSTGFTVKA